MIFFTHRRRSLSLLLPLLSSLLVSTMASPSSTNGNLFDRHENNQLPRQPRIIGGHSISPNEMYEKYPYMVSLQWDGQHRCGGTMIAPDLILTAAHCAYVSWDEDKEGSREWSFTDEELADGYVPSLYTAHLGMADLDDNYNHFSSDNNATTKWKETLIIEKTIMHPQFEITSTPPHPDVAIVKVFGSSQFVKEEQFAKLNTNPNLPPPTNNENEDTTLITMGYGKTTTPNSESTTPSDENTLQYTTLDYIPNNKCKAMGGGALWNLIKDDMMCGYGHGKRDSCSGDSGGPLFWEDGGDHSVNQVGIVSWGVGCADVRYPGVYTRTSYHSDWIRHQTCLLSKSPPESFACPPKPSNGVTILPFSPTPLIVQFHLPSVAQQQYGLLVESVSKNDDDDEEKTLLDIPPGSYDGMAGGIEQHAIRVKLGGRYRIALLNTAGRVAESSSSDDGWVRVTIGEESLVDFSAHQSKHNNLQVYSIVREFSITEVDYSSSNNGDTSETNAEMAAYSTTTTTDSPSHVPSSLPSSIELLPSERTATNQTATVTSHNMLPTSSPINSPSIIIATSQIHRPLITITAEDTEEATNNTATRENAQQDASLQEQTNSLSLMLDVEDLLYSDEVASMAVNNDNSASSFGEENGCVDDSGHAHVLAAGLSIVVLHLMEVF